MPLRAIVDGQEILAPLLDAEQWQELKSNVQSKKADVVLPCCSSPALLRTSKLGTKHFVHKRKAPDCDWKPETWQHLKAKSDIVIACQNAGYIVSTEVSGDGWRADVLAQKGNAKIAFEVQWSRQTLEETERRQEIYNQADVRGCWFFRKSPLDKYEPARPDLPIFEISVSEIDSIIISEEKTYPLLAFVEALLSKNIRFCKDVTSSHKQEARIVFVDVECWKCKKPYHIYYVHDFKTDCGNEVSARRIWADTKIEFLPEIRDEVQTFLNTDKGRSLKISAVKKRYSKAAQKAYMSFGCPYCDALYGDMFVSDSRLDAMYAEDEAPAILEKELILHTRITENYPHWCFPTHGEFCCNQSQNS